MKISKENYSNLLNAFKNISKETIEEHRKFIIKEAKAKDVEMRLRWDIFWSVNQVCPNIYSYLNDSQIDTALKSIMKELGYEKS